MPRDSISSKKTAKGELEVDIARDFALFCTKYITNISWLILAVHFGYFFVIFMLLLPVRTALLRRASTE